MMVFLLNKKIVYSFLLILIVVSVCIILSPESALATCLDDRIDCSVCAVPEDVSNGDCDQVSASGEVNYTYPDGKCEPPTENCNPSLSRYTADCNCVDPEVCQPSGICYESLRLSCSAPTCGIDGGDGICNIGENVTWIANASYGVKPYNYVFTDNLGTVIQSGNQVASIPSISFSYTTGGLKSGTFTITNNPTPNSCTQSIRIIEPLSWNGVCLANGSSTPLTGLVPGRDDVLWTVSARGGVGDHYYTWSGTDDDSDVDREALSSPVVSNTNLITTSFISMDYQTDGTKVMRVEVYDTDNPSNVLTSVCPSATYTTPKINYTEFRAVSASCPSGVGCSEYFIDEPVTWSVVGVSGGTGTFTYTWDGDTEGAVSSGASLGPINYTSVGEKRVFVTIGSGSKEKQDSKTITLKEKELVVSCTASPTSVSLAQNQDVRYTASISGGSGKYKIDWGGAINVPGTTSGKDSFTTSYRYENTGTKNVTLTATSLRDTDGDGEYELSSTPVTASGDKACPAVNVTVPSLETPICSTRPNNSGNNTVYTGTRITFSVTPQGGIPSTYKYEWTAGPWGPFEGTDTTQSVYKTFDTGGTYTATVKVDSYLPDGQTLVPVKTGSYPTCSASIIITQRSPICGDGTCNEPIENKENCNYDCGGCPEGQVALTKTECVGPLAEPPPYVPPEPGVLPNPLGDVTDVTGFAAKIADTLVKFLTPLIVVFFIVSGIMFITARGNPEQLKLAKRALMYTFVGAGVVLGAWAFANLIKTTLGG